MQKRAVETKERILSSAIKEFSENGFHGTKIDEISTKANVNKQRIYAYFGSKENLFSEVLKNCFQKIVSSSEKSFFNLLDKNIPHLGEILLHHYISFHEQNPFFWRLIAWENLDGGKHKNSLKGLRDEVFEHIRDLYHKGQEQSVYPKEVSFESFIFVLSGISFFYYSNQHIMSQTMNMDLFDKKNQEMIITQSLLLLFTKK